MEKKLHITALFLYLIAIALIMAAMVTKRPIFTVFGAVVMVAGWGVRTYAENKYGDKSAKL